VVWEAGGEIPPPTRLALVRLISSSKVIEKTAQHKYNETEKEWQPSMSYTPRRNQAKNQNNDQRSKRHAANVSATKRVRATIERKQSNADAIQQIRHAIGREPSN
jgi:hypothetical protein